MNLSQLIEKAKSGDKEAMQEIIRQFDPLLVSLSQKEGTLDHTTYENLFEILIRFIEDYKMNSN